MLKVDGHFIAMKGSKNELEDSSSALAKLNSNLVLEKKITLPKLNDKRILLKIKKQKEIDDKYPREFSKIKKKAL